MSRTNILLTRLNNSSSILYYATHNLFTCLFGSSKFYLTTKLVPRKMSKPKNGTTTSVVRPKVADQHVERPSNTTLTLVESKIGLMLAYQIK